MFRSAYRFIEMVPHGVCQGADGVVKNEQVFVLVLAESEHQGVEDERQVGHQLCASLFLQSGKGTTKEREENIIQQAVLKEVCMRPTT